MPEVYQSQEVSQEGNTDKCLRMGGQLEEAVVMASTSSCEVGVGSNKVGCAVGYSAQNWGNVEQEGICSLTQGQDQEIEVNRLRGFWADNQPLLSEEAKECVSVAWRVGTKSRYKLAWIRYCEWIEGGSLYLGRDLVSSVANYLAHLFHKHKLAYRTLGVHRLAISVKLPP